MYISALWSYAIHRQDGAGGLIIIIWPCVNSYQRALGMCGRGTFLRAWFPGVHYLEAHLYWKVTLGAGVLSAVRKQEASASRRLCMYYNHAKSNP